MAGDERSVVQVVPAQSTIEGGGFEVYRPFPTSRADWFDPFLLLDEMAPHHHAPGMAVGAPPHPHRGFETVTYALRGEVEHRDAAGHHGIIGPGDVQWMTAGDGIVHSEMPSARIQTEGGVGHGLQLWVDLPTALRRTPPRYQALLADDHASVDGEGWAATVVAGPFLDVVGPAVTHTPVGITRISVEPGASLSIPVEAGHTALVYVLEGRAGLGTDVIGVDAHHLAVLDRHGEVVVSVPADGARLDCVLLTGEPIGGPMVRSGPFVMSTIDELEEAYADFRAGRMGSLVATGTV